MKTVQKANFVCFNGFKRIASGSLQSVALAYKQSHENGAEGPLLIIDNSTGRSIDIDIRGTDDEVIARLGAVEAIVEPSDPPRGRGRPKLGVVAREVTLLPRHWEWLAEQPGGASVALRKLVEEARRANADKDIIRNAQQRAYYFMSTIGGDLPGFEEGARALFRNDRRKFSDITRRWPRDVREHVDDLAFQLEE